MTDIFSESATIQSDYINIEYTTLPNNFTANINYYSENFTAEFSTESDRTSSFVIQLSGVDESTSIYVDWKYQNDGSEWVNVPTGQNEFSTNSSCTEIINGNQTCTYNLVASENLDLETWGNRGFYPQITILHPSKPIFPILNFIFGFSTNYGTPANFFYSDPQDATFTNGLASFSFELRHSSATGIGWQYSDDNGNSWTDIIPGDGIIQSSSASSGTVNLENYGYGNLGTAPDYYAYNSTINVATAQFFPNRKYRGKATIS